MPSPTPTTPSPDGCSASPRRTSAPQPADTNGSRWARTGVANRCCPATRTTPSPTNCLSPARRPQPTTTSPRWLVSSCLGWLGQGYRCAPGATWPRTGAARSTSSSGSFAAGSRSRDRQALLQAEVFLDVRGCHGDLSTDVLDRILLAGGSRGPFRVQMARAAVVFRPPFRLVRPAAGNRVNRGSQAGRNRGDRAPGPALRAHGRLDRAQHRAETTSRRGRRHAQPRQRRRA